MISKLESGQSKETAGIVALALACGVRPEWLFNGSGSMRTEAARGPPLAEAAVSDTRKSGLPLSQPPPTSVSNRGSALPQPPLAKPNLDPNVLALARAIESLPPDARASLQKVTDAFVKSQAIEDWNGIERRRGGHKK